MPDTFAELAEAMHDALLDRYQATAAPEDEAPFLAFQLGQPIPDSVFQAAPGQPPDGGRLLALEFMARQANRVGLVSESMYHATGLDIDALYQQLVDGAAPYGEGITLFEAAKQAATAALDDWLASVDRPAAASPEARYRRIEVDPADWFERESGAWTDMRIDHHSQSERGVRSPIPRDSPIVKWRPAAVELQAVLGQPPDIETVKRLADNVATRFSIGVPGDALPARAGAGLEAAGDAIGRGATVTVGRAYWHRVAVEPPPANEPVLRAALFRRFRDELLSIRPDVDRGGYEASSSGFSLELQSCLVRIRRPWLSTQLLNLQNWYVPTFARGSLASGTGEDHQKLLELLPIACVLVRNVAIRAAQCSVEDLRQADISSHMGPIALLGRSIDSTSSEVTIRIPGMQLVGWICQVMPVLPPSNAPSN